MKNRREREKNGGYTLVELVAVLAILAILVMLSVPHVDRYTEAARRVASETEALAVADAVNRYLHDKDAEGKLNFRSVRVLINLEMNQPDNALSDYIGGGMEGARIEQIYVDFEHCFLGQITYVNQFDRVRISYDSEGNRTLEHVDSAI